MPLSDGQNQGWTIQTDSKASGTSTITATTVGAASLTFPSASATASLIPGSTVGLSGGAAAENVTISAAFVPGSAAVVPITGGTVVNANQNLARYPVPPVGLTYADAPTTAFLAGELPAAPVAGWATASGNAANVPSIASKALVGPTVVANATDQAGIPGQWIVYLRPTVGGYPLGILTVTWGDGTTDVRNEAPYALEHKYAADGVYTVNLAVASTQGNASVARTATITNGTTVWS